METRIDQYKRRMSFLDVLNGTNTVEFIVSYGLLKSGDRCYVRMNNGLCPARGLSPCTVHS